MAILDKHGSCYKPVIREGAEKCPCCDGVGTRRSWFRTRPCFVCGGSGFIKTSWNDWEKQPWPSGLKLEGPLPDWNQEHVEWVRRTYDEIYVSSLGVAKTTYDKYGLLYSYGLEWADARKLEPPPPSYHAAPTKVEFQDAPQLVGAYKGMPVYADRSLADIRLDYRLHNGHYFSGWDMPSTNDKPKATKKCKPKRAAKR